MPQQLSGVRATVAALWFRGQLVVGGCGSGKCEVTAVFEVVAVAVAAASVRMAAETVEATAAGAVVVVEKAKQWELLI